MNILSIILFAFGLILFIAGPGTLSLAGAGIVIIAAAHLFYDRYKHCLLQFSDGDKEVSVK